MTKQLGILCVVMAGVLGLVSTANAGTYSGGTGDPCDPYQLASAADWQELVATSGDWSAHFVLTADIDLAGVSGLMPVAPDTDSGSWAFQGTAFTGSLDGAGHVIANATINLPSTDCVGLFGYLGSDGEIVNLGVENADITGYYFVGGLVGLNFYGTVSGCYATGSVDGGYSVGGLVGRNGSGMVSGCYASGSVTGVSGVGGLVGVNGGTVSDCYATGSVTGSGDYVGGLVGSNGGTVSGSFWDVETSGQAGSAGGKGLATAQMKTVSLFQNAGWGASGLWVMSDGVDYPRLAWEGTGYPAIPAADPLPLSGSGTEADPYQVWTAGEFALLSRYADTLSSHIDLMADIDMTGETLYPIGDLGPFAGVFDGHGHVISNAVINQPSGNYVGLFGYVDGGEIVNLGVENADMTGDRSVGGLVGWNDSGTVSGCYATGSVTGDERVGGLVGWNASGTVSGCYATGTVTGSGNVGGLAGFNWSGTVSDCYATGSVTGDYDVGGLVGWNASGTVSGSFWDVQTSGQSSSDGGTGKTTAEMMQRATFTAAGWDFLGESANGDEDPWRMCSDGVDYPRLRWEYDYVADWLCPDGTALDDFGYLNSWWGDTDCDAGNNYCDGVDIDRSGSVDLADLLVLIDHWLRDIVAPSIPQNLVETDAGDNWASMCWDTSTDNWGGVSYTIFRNGIPVETQSDTCFTDTGLTVDTTYTYTVAAFDAAGNYSDWSDPLVITILDGMEWVYVDDPGVSGHEGFTGYMSKYETTNGQYCEYLNAAYASGDIVISGGDVNGNSGPYNGQIYYDMDGGHAQISYNGNQFYVESRDGYSMANHPVVEVSWYGATAFACTSSAKVAVLMGVC